MKVFFDASMATSEKVFLTVKNILDDLSVKFTYTWVGGDSAWQDKKLDQDNRNKIFTERMNAILAADIIICDVSVSSMRIGHELAFALEKSKPTLVVANEKDRDTDTLFLRGSRSGFLTLKNYDSYDTLGKIIKKFIEKNQGGGKARLNLSLETYFNKYLEWKQFQTGVSKTEILKNALEEFIEKDKWNDQDN